MSKSRHPEKINKPFNPIKKKPSWIRSKILDTKIFFKTKEVVNQKSSQIDEHLSIKSYMF